MKDLEYCKKYILDFLKSSNKVELEQQLEWFKTYNFSERPVEENKDVHDEDNTDLAKAVYFILWQGKLPFLTSLENMEEYYGGETINTFNTLFQEELEGAKLFVEESDTEFYKEVNNFKKKYLTIGNFMLLPKGKVGSFTLNTKKGSYCFKYKDYADLFFYDLFETNELNEFKQANTEYFKMGKKNFLKKIFLINILKIIKHK